jgi:hypothetical protein
VVVTALWHAATYPPRTAARLAFDTAGAVVDAGARTGRRVEWAIREQVELAALAALDAVLASPRMDEAVERVLASDLAERSVARALSGDLVDVVAQDLVRFAVVERVTERLLADGIAERLATRIVEGPELEVIVESAVESPAMERLVNRVIESRLVEQSVTRIVDDTTTRLPESPALWTLIEEISQSEAVTEAITHQGMGFADQVADDMREQTRHVDDRMERVAQRLFRRRRRGPGPTGLPPTAPEAP